MHTADVAPAERQVASSRVDVPVSRSKRMHICNLQVSVFVLLYFGTSKASKLTSALTFQSAGLRACASEVLTGVSLLAPSSTNVRILTPEASAPVEPRPKLLGHRCSRFHPDATPLY